MTLQEFDNTVDSWEDLISLDYENDLYIVSDVLNDEERDDAVSDEIQEFTGRWNDLLSYLEDIPNTSYYHKHVGYFEYDELEDDDFDEAKAEVREALLDCDYFEEDDEEDDEEDEEYVETADSIGSYTKRVSESGYTFEKVSERESGFGSESMDFATLMG